MKKLPQQLTVVASVGLLLLAAACADSTAPHNDCGVTSAGQQCVPQ